MYYRFFFSLLLLMGFSGNASGTGRSAPQHSDVLRSADPEKAGFDREKLALVDTILLHAVRDSAFPGAVLLVAKNGMVVYHRAYGRYGYEQSAEKVDTSTVYDIASLTKVIATTTACMRLIDERKLLLEDRVVKYLPEFGRKGKSGITIYNLLTHTSGLPGWLPIYAYCRTPECLLDSIYSTATVYPTGDTAVYSDLGFIVLGKVIEKVCAKPLDRYIDSVFFTPLGMTSTMYNPPASMFPRIAPTEIDTLREKTGRPLQGHVHDENAAVLGGVSGHAGVFSTAHDLAVMLEMIRNGGRYNGRHYLRKSTIAQFIKRQSSRSTRALGWDTKKAEHSWAGTLVSERAFIHTGFTGTSVVVDPDRDFIIVFLTNRVCPSRENSKITAIRPKVHDAILNALK
jgi:CubicO group peptidase (beta-lactamase class C family)